MSKKTERLAKQVRATRGLRHVAQPKAASALSAFFQNVFCGNPIIHNLGLEPTKAKIIILQTDNLHNKSMSNQISIRDEILAKLDANFPYIRERFGIESLG
ncbi:MAG: hypothetical protein E7211_19105, partial [Clostridium lundense]|nr:hypothetical protein [Clostridium lundense]